MNDREHYGRLVRETWVAWAREQMDVKPSWLDGWNELDDGQREVDMRIGEAVAAAERERMRLAVFGCASCGTVHQPVRTARGVNYAGSADGHPWSPAYVRHRAGLAFMLADLLGETP